MRVRIFSPAEKDLKDGYRFYEDQLPGLGSYFLDALYSDIDSLAYFGGIHSADGFFRIIDEPGEDYLYPQSYFILAQLPREAQAALRVSK